MLFFYNNFNQFLKIYFYIVDLKSKSMFMRKIVSVLFLLLLSFSTKAHDNPIEISLNGFWNLYYCLYDKNSPVNPSDLKNGNLKSVPAIVPGNVELDLLSAGKINNPETGNNIYELRKYEAYQWWYSREFDTPRIKKGERVEIVFEGLDCFGKIWINDHPVGETDNMLIEHNFDITDFLNTDGRNNIYVRINPAVREAQKYINPAVGTRKYFRVEQVRVRKAPHMYGWDIMPRLISAGLWRGVHLDIKKPTRIKDVFWITDEVNVPDKTAHLMVDWQIGTDYSTIDGLSMEISLKHKNKIVYKHLYPVYNNCNRQKIFLDNVSFWWPRGYGEPALYDATVRLLNNKNQILDERHQHVGIRTTDLIFSDGTSEKDSSEFLFKVNGEKIFVKGTNWVPLDALHSRDRDHLNNVFKMIVDLNCNMIRCWGGNVYEDTDFFDLCDKNGVMVWQDFSLAGTAYPQDNEFVEKIRKEAISVVIKLRNHPSLMLWSGNNETDISLGWNFKKPIDPALDRISREVLPLVIWEYDPLRPFLPSSPYCSEECFKRGNDAAFMPEAHLWGPRGYYKASFYTSEVKAHFVSEIGYHGCPNRCSLEKMFDTEYVYPLTKNFKWNDEWQTKAVRTHRGSSMTVERNNLMIKQVKALFGDCPEDLDQFIFASQSVQAEAMKYFIELWRADKFQKTGIIWWNLRDGWPIISDAIVDYYNSKKLAYFYIRRVQTNSCVMIGDDNGKGHPVMAVNDTREEKTGTVTVRDADNEKILFLASFSIPVNGKKVIGYIPKNQEQSMWLIDYTIGKKRFSNHYLEGKAPFSLKDYQRWYKKLGIQEKRF